MKTWPAINKWLPWIIAGVFGVWILSTLRMPRDKEWALSEFGKLPLLSNGRFQPMDSLARNSLLQMLEKQSHSFSVQCKHLGRNELLPTPKSIEPEWLQPLRDRMVATSREPVRTGEVDVTPISLGHAPGGNAEFG